MKSPLLLTLTLSISLFSLLSAAVPGAAHGAGWSTTTSMATARSSHTATLLPSGKVLVAGGTNGVTSLASAELYDPASASWSKAADLPAPCNGHTATLLATGKVLVAGGYNGGHLASASLYDPATNSWGAAGAMHGARSGHTATLLSTGKVLVAGGFGASGYLADAELYDPATNGWAYAGSMATGRVMHTATLLRNGTVLVVGGDNVATAEYYDPATDRWYSAGSMAGSRYRHSATLLPDGRVMVIGGISNMTGFLATAEVCDPVTGTWGSAAAMGDRRYDHTATLLPTGRILLTGGMSSGDATAAVRYDPGTDSWSNAGYMSTARQNHAATLLTNGKVLVTGGMVNYASPLASAQLYDPTTNVWKRASNMAESRTAHTATLLSDGYLLLAGGFSATIPNAVATTRLYNTTLDSWYPFSTNLSIARALHTATLLPGNKVLMAGGFDGYLPLAATELHDRSSGFPISAGNMTDPRFVHTATLLATGNVLVTGGVSFDDLGPKVIAGAEQFSPGTTSWTGAASMSAPRFAHTATLLTGGKVLVAGGSNNYDTLAGMAGAELYNPTTNQWSSAGNMAAARCLHTATLLPNGKVLVAGGYNGLTDRADAELYNPATNSWSSAGSMATPREYHSATLLADGKVLVAGGLSGDIPLASAEIYDPATNSWSSAASMAIPREWHTATLLPGGEVLVTGGDDGTTPLDAMEVYTPREKNAAMVTLGNLIQTYNGTGRQATAATTPAGLNVTLTYNGSATPPAAAGSYAVVATVNDPNYAGRATGTLVIAPAGGYTLEILLNSPTGGSVVNTTAQSACGDSRCVSVLAPGSYLLTANPAQYYLFSGWSGDCTGSWNCSVPLTANRSVSAGFVFDTYHSVLVDTPPGYFWGMSPAYNQAGDGAVIKAWAVEFAEDLTCYGGKTVTLKGGYNGGYTAATGLTTIHGTFTVAGGTIIVENIAVR